MSRGKKQTIKQCVVSVLAVLFISMFPIMFLYFRNAGDAYAHELVKPMIVYCCFGMICWMISSIFSRSVQLGSLISMPIILVFQNYIALQNLTVSVFASLKWWHILPICVMVLLHVAWLIKRFVPKSMAELMVPIIAIVSGAMILINAIPAVPILVQKVAAKPGSNAQNNLVSEDGTDNSTGPNVYWLLFDEYSNFDIIEKYYHYDNSAFAKHLEELGFNVSYNSANESQQTFTIIANLVSLDYLADDSMTNGERAEIRWNSNALFPLMQQNGYKLRGIGDTTDDFPMNGSQSIKLSQTMGGESFEELLLKKTALGCFATEVFSERVISIRNCTEVFSQPEFFKEKGTFTMWYESFPHQPFVFNADGTESNITKWHDWMNPDAYLGSYIYATKIMTTVIDRIIQNDPECVIVLQSDHSARSMKDAGGNMLIDKYDRRHCLNAVYYGGEDISEIEGQSGVNTWRLVLNRLFDMDFEMLEVPVSEYEF